MNRRNYSSVPTAANFLTQESERLKINTRQRLERSRLDFLQTVNKPPTEQGAFDELSTKLLSFIEEGQMLAQKVMLESLLFEGMEQREESVKDAHEATLDWMFQRNGTKFKEWLETENGIYWVRGKVRSSLDRFLRIHCSTTHCNKRPADKFLKAGSGKSTLIKYICNHENTLEALGPWANGEKLFTASFFFWNSGFPMQKSQVGLLQSLLYQVLRACPALIKEICLQKGPGELWKRKELFDALTKISTQNQLPAKFCFFVDGLDEYEGEDEEIIALLQDLASSPNVKICVSSRPWNAFVDAFDGFDWKLVLEHFTSDDMRKYMEIQLVQNEAFSRVTLHDPRCQSLVSQISQKAQGVWLWVFLVVRDLLRDLTGEEQFPLLQRRLDRLPAELEKYYEDILDRIDKIHQQETARIFLVAVTAIQPVPLLSLHYLSMEAVYPNYAISEGFGPLSKRRLFPIKKKWTKLLNSRCRDLLELNDISSLHGDSFLEPRVVFSHRTVRDFLRNYHNELQQRAGVHFDARVALCQTFICLIKQSFFLKIYPPNTHSDRLPNFEIVDEMLIYARDYERAKALSMEGLLDELDRVNWAMTNGRRGHWTSLRPKDAEVPFEEEQNFTFLALAIQAGLRLYVKKKLKADKTLITQKCGRPLLDYACRPKRLSRILAQLGQDDVLDPEIIRILLEHESDPNQLVTEDKTVWSCFVSACYDTLTEARSADNRTLQDLKVVWFEVAKLLIEHGAIIRSGKEEQWILPQIPGAIFGEEKTERLVLLSDEVARRGQRNPSLLWGLLGRT